MAVDDLCWLPAADVAAAIRRRKLLPVEVMRAVLARIERVNPTLNAFVTLTPEQALRDARAAERAVMNKGARLGPLHGVPRACAAFETLRPWAHLRPPVE